MFCKNCGNELEEEARFCAVCGTPVETSDAGQQSAQEPTAPEQSEQERSEQKQSEQEQSVPEQPEQKQSEQEQSVPEQPEQKQSEQEQSAPEQTEQQQAAPEPRAQGQPVPAQAPGEPVKERKKGRKIIWIIAAAVVLVIAIPCLVNAARINDFFKRTFLSPEEYFQSVAKKEVKEIAELTGGYYGDILSKLNFYDASCSVELKVEPGESMDRLTKPVENYLEAAGIDLAQLKSINIGMNTSVKDNVFGCGLTTAMNRNSLLSFNMVLDAAQGEAYFQFPELVKTYIGIDMEEYDIFMLLENQEINRTMIEALPAKAEVEKMVNRYLNIIVQNIDNVKQGRRKELKVEGITQKCTELRITIDGETMQNIQEAILTEALEDKTLEKIIVDWADAMEQDGDEIYEEFLEEVEEALEDIENMDTDRINPVKMTVYVDHKGNIIGYDIGEKDGHEYCSVHTASKGKNIAYEITYDNYGYNVFEISGSGKKSGNRLTGDFEVKVEGISVVDLKVMGLDMEKLKKGYLNGKVEMTLSSVVSSALSDEIDIPAVSSIIRKSSLLLDCKASANSVDCKVTLNYDEEEMLRVSIAYKFGSGSKIAVPSGKSVIMVEDMDDFMDYYDEVDWNKLLDAMEKTGVLTETAEMLYDVLDDLDDLIESGYFLPYGYYYGW